MTVNASADRGQESTAANVLRASSLAKSFGATAALSDCSLKIRAGEVHALLGENGSGKSTFAKLVTGVYEPDSGSICLGSGNPTRFRSPADARNQGVVAVYQDILVAPSLSVVENVWLGSDGLFRSRTSKATKRDLAAATLERLLARDIELDAPVRSLSLSDQQACCLARAFVQNFQVLVLDEATSTLDLECRNRLFEMVRELTAAGKGVLFVSHRMDEIFDLADRITIVRSGYSVATLRTADATEPELLELLTGATVQREVENRRPCGPVVMRVRSRDAEGPDASPTVEICRDQITALAGLEGHGQTDFLLSLWGAGDTGKRVNVVRDGSDFDVTSPYHAKKLGIAYVPRDRRTETTFAELSLRQNFELPTIHKDVRFGLIRSSLTDKRFGHFADEFGIVYRRSGDPIRSLSGGNQQKIVLARWLALDPQVLLLNDPTRGVDIGTKHKIYSVLRSLRDRGVTVVINSSEIDEILELADRVIVFRGGMVAEDLSEVRVTRENILKGYFGLGEPT